MTTLERIKTLLAPGGKLLWLIPAPEGKEQHIFFNKQFPQGQFYIIHKQVYLQMLKDRFGLLCQESHLIYGRPNALLKKKVKWTGNILVLLELLTGNLLHQKPYMLSYSLKMQNTDE